MNDVFAHIRPYRKEEVPAALELLLSAMNWNDVLIPFIGEEATSTLLTAMAKISSVEEFQELVSKRFIEKVLEKTASEVTFSNPNSFDPNGGLFISNHRDIVLDPSLINLALLSLDGQTTEIGIGSNLLETPWVEALVRLNKSFIVKRGGSPREQLARSAEVAAYVRHVIESEFSSVWLAQREGRAKDGDDRTSPALIRMLMNGEGPTAWNALRVYPVTLSYEWDPCDAMKVKELLLSEANGGVYEKRAGEDERSMKQGLFGWKGRVHIAIGEQVVWHESEEEGRPHVWLSNLIDNRLHQEIKIWPSQHWAAQQLSEMDSSMANNWSSIWDASQLSEVDSQLCFDRVRQIQKELCDLPFTSDEIHRKWCEITVKPLLNQKRAAEHKVKV
jgi:hypothetical protein